jgi:hypothetical protein
MLLTLGGSAETAEGHRTLVGAAQPLGRRRSAVRMRAWLQHSDGIHRSYQRRVRGRRGRAARLLAKRVDLALDGGDGDGACPPPGQESWPPAGREYQARAARRHPAQTTSWVNPARGVRR